MIPRGVLDISWLDLARGALGCIVGNEVEKVQAEVESLWSKDNEALACLSVRSGFDLLLSELAWPAGSEILVSAVTIPDMLRIIEAHGLIAIPLDVDSRTLTIDPRDIAKRSGPRTKGLLVAHLFGSRPPLDIVVKQAHQHGLLVFEDCAQAFDGSAFRGHPEADVSLFSFGPIKTQTALGGALLTIRRPALLTALRNRQASYPRRNNLSFLRRLWLFAGLKALSQPQLLGAFAWLMSSLGYDFDALVSQRVRSFARGELLPQLRRQPAMPQLRLLRERLAHSSRAWIERRCELARAIAAKLARPICGADSAEHSHWVLPIESDHPEQLQQQLIAAGFDATRKASSLVVVPAPADHPEWEAVHARRWLERVVYLPLHPALSARAINRVARIVNAFESTVLPQPAPADCERQSRVAEFMAAKSR